MSHPDWCPQPFQLSKAAANTLAATTAAAGCNGISPRLRHLIMLTLLCLPGCASGPPGAVPVRVAEPAKTLVYECKDYEFVARTRARGMTLYLPGENLELEQVGTGKDARYEGQGVTFWRGGDAATLDLGSRILGSCRLNAGRAPWEDARFRGVNFRAVGQEPGWYLEIQHERNILFVSSHGGRRILLPTPDPELEDGLAVYSANAAGHAVLVEISAEFCQDTMSGEVFENAVRVSVDGASYLGCGVALEADWD